jgi:hypothetical protein
MRTLYCNGNCIGVGLPFGHFNGVVQPFFAAALLAATLFTAALLAATWAPAPPGGPWFPFR